MPEEKQVLGVVRFGRFELSADSGELRKDDVRLKLSGQAIQVLAMLAGNPGRLVTREELQQKLWLRLASSTKVSGHTVFIRSSFETRWPLC
jgi:DNA-binding winged helix-turn-helix (wHTH) protein